MRRATKAGDQKTVSWDCPVGICASLDALLQQTRPQAGSSGATLRPHHSRVGRARARWNSGGPATLWCQSGPRRRCCRFHRRFGQGKTIVSVIPTRPSPASSPAAKPSATTSVRRITGGNSPLLSGTGMPSCALGSSRSPGGGFVGEDLAAEGLAADGLEAGALAGEGLVGITLTMVFPCPKRRWKRQQRRRGPD